MAKPTAQQCHAMTTYYVKLYKQKYGVDPQFNRHTARWGFESVLTDMPKDKAKKLLEFYFDTGSGNRHDLDWFFYNYDKLERSVSEVDKDRAHREKLRAESEERARRWRERGNTGIADN